MGAFFGLSAVALGAFGAHGLENTLSAHALKRYHTGVEYQFYHVMAIFVVAIFSQLQTTPSRLLKTSGISFIVGILLFSGSLYLYALTGITTFGIITPFGGLALILGWLFLLIFGIKKGV